MAKAGNRFTDTELLIGHLGLINDCRVTNGMGLDDVARLIYVLVHLSVIDYGLTTSSVPRHINLEIITSGNLN